MSFEINHGTDSSNVDWPACQSLAGRLLAEAELTLCAEPRAAWFEAEPPRGAGVYVVWADGFEAPIYVGESSNLARRHRNHSGTTRSSALRRNIGRQVFGFELEDRRFTADEDARVTEYLALCRYAFLPVDVGRLELEEFLIARHRPRLNKKAKHRSERLQPVTSG